MGQWLAWHTGNLQLGPLLRACLQRSWGSCKVDIAEDWKDFCLFCILLYLGKMTTKLLPIVASLWINVWAFWKNSFYYNLKQLFEIMENFLLFLSLGWFLKSILFIYSVIFIDKKILFCSLLYFPCLTNVWLIYRCYLVNISYTNSFLI